ncbi:MAG TPA: CDF family Co(II)/Ni(II) efflux transporter DmeF [Polyangiaceae bacterium]|jgi:cation diffusion facilitator family transporter
MHADHTEHDHAGHGHVGHGHGHAHDEHAEPANPPRLSARERGARWVVLVTSLMMIIELAVGYTTHSLALTADGWHMGTHAAALGLASFAYWFARTRARDHVFSFGTGKVHALAGYTSAIILTGVALSMLVESGLRLFRPESVRYAEAIPVAGVGLLVNFVSVLLLSGGDADATHRGHAHGDHGHDHNHRAAYLHILADTITSLLAVVALVAGRYLGWTLLDPAMGLLGGAIVLRWAVGLCLDAGRQLLDVNPSAELAARLRAALESIDDVRVEELRLWSTGPAKHGCVVTLVTASPRASAHYRSRLLEIANLAHLTVEVRSATE